jgi:oligoendopeptidase F
LSESRSGSLATERRPPKKIPQRGEIDRRYKWSVEDVYASDASWEEDFSRAERLLDQIAAYAGRLAESGATLLDFLGRRDELEDLIDRVVVFASLRRDEDMRVSTYQAMADRATHLATRCGEALAFTDPELLAIPAERLAALRAEEPGLASYAHALDNTLRRKPHTLAESEERLLAMGAESGMTPSVVFGMFNNADLKYGVVLDEDGAEIELTKARFSVLQNSKRRSVREESWRRLHESYQRFENTLAANLAGQMKRHAFLARARRYPSSLHAALDGANIPVEVYRNLIQTVRVGIAPLHRYMRMRTRVLGVEPLK